MRSATQVLYGSYTQTQAMSLARRPGDVDGRRARPADPPSRAGGSASTARSSSCRPRRRSPRAAASGAGSVSPELATLMAYVQDPPLRGAARVRPPRGPVPGPGPGALLPGRRCLSASPAQIAHHRLRRELIATIVANQLVDRAGMTFAFRLAEETGARRAAVGPRLRGRPRRLRDARLLGRGRGARQPDRGRDPALDADRGPAAGRARRALAGARGSAARAST